MLGQNWRVVDRVFDRCCTTNCEQTRNVPPMYVRPTNCQTHDRSMFRILTISTNCNVANKGKGVKKKRERTNRTCVGYRLKGGERTCKNIREKKNRTCVRYRLKRKEEKNICNTNLSPMHLHFNCCCGFGFSNVQSRNNNDIPITMCTQS